MPACLPHHINDPPSPTHGSWSLPLHPQVGRDNPAELKAQKLARGLQRGVLDRDLKPNSEERRKLQVGDAGTAVRHSVCTLMYASADQGMTRKVQRVCGSAHEV